MRQAGLRDAWKRLGQRPHRLLLASVNPDVVQYTGPSDYLPEGVGLLRFSTSEEAAAALEDVDAHYARHSRAAREIAECCFSARDAVTGLLDHALGN